MLIHDKDLVLERTKKWNKKNPDYDEVLLEFNLILFNITKKLKFSLCDNTKHHEK